MYEPIKLSRTTGMYQHGHNDTGTVVVSPNNTPRHMRLNSAPVIFVTYVCG